MVPRARTWLLVLATLITGAVTGGQLGCSCAAERAACTRDGDCGDDMVCYPDDSCAPRAVADRVGASVGDECAVVGGQEIGCDADEICRMGTCQGPADGDAGVDAGDAASGLCTTGSATDGAPLFGGATEVIADGADAIVINWLAAADETLPALLRYHVYVATAAGGQDLASPTATVVGVTTARLTGLTTGTTYYVVVRAEDEAHQIDCNVRERSATPQQANACVDYATAIKPLFDARCIGCHSGAAAPRGLHLDSYAGARAGGASGNTIVACQPDSSLLFLKVSLDTPPVGVRMPFGGPYLAAAQIDQVRRWIAAGAPETCPADAALCGDTTPPAFAGVTTATLSGASAVALAWAAGADDQTPVAGLLYDVYEATAAGGEAFAAPPRATTAAGATTITLTGLTPNQTYCYVVRARDGAGNRDANTVERCVTTPAASCIDYATVVQPIFDAECIHCHSGATPPRGLRLDSFAGVGAGGQTGNTVVACQSPQSLLFQKISMATPPVGVRMPADGPPYLAPAQISAIGQWISEGARSSCMAPDPCGDATPPTFAGLVNATLSGGNAVVLTWAAGNDAVTPITGLRYDVFEALAPGGEAFAAPPKLTTVAGATTVTVTGLAPGQPYCYVVRARDGAGNRDANTVERCVTTPAASCIDYATVVQPIFDAECIHCHSGATPPRGLRLDSFAGVSAGGQTGNTVVACQSPQSLLFQKISMATPPVGVRMPADGPPYLAPAQISAIGQWISEGARSSCAAPDPCSDATPPTFAGVTTATAVNPTSVRLCWNPATDNLTPPAGLIYDAYLAGAPGGQSFAAAPYQTSAAGATCMQIDALAPVTQGCWVVRARDGAGNRDGNTVERCVTTPAVPAGCVDYATMIQPLLDRNCTRCHSGARPPQWQRLDSYDHVIAGSARRTTVDACNTGASLLLSKISSTPSVGKRMPFDGPPYLAASQIALVSQWIATGARRSCTAASTCGDATAPTFAGASTATATDATTIRVCWPAATDAQTPAASIRYDLYESATAGGQSYTQPPQATVTGALCTDVRVGPATTMYFVVRARDLDGNRSSNTVQVSATTAAAACAVEYDALVQPIFSARCTHCHQGEAAPRFLDLRTYGGVVAGGSIRDAVDACDWPGSLLNTKTAGTACGRRMPADGAPWLAPSERSVLQRWIETGARRTCAATSSCGDVVAPSFAGATAATAPSPTTIQVCWNPATDGTTAADSIVYELYDGTTAANPVLNRPAPYAVTGETCATVEVPTAQQTCFIVRARDLNGNRDGNSVARCATPAGACFGYDDVIQPVLSARCVHCHSGNNPPQGLRWDTYAHAVGDGGVDACRPGNSKIIDQIDGCSMPQDTTSGACRACLTNVQTRLIRQWIGGGAEQDCPWGGCP